MTVDGLSWLVVGEPQMALRTDNGLFEAIDANADSQPQAAITFSGNIASLVSDLNRHFNIE
jgi:hypothetical protein